MWMPLRAYVEVAEFDGLLQLEHSVRSGDVAAVKSFIRTQQAPSTGDGMQISGPDVLCFCFLGGLFLMRLLVGLQLC